MISILVRKDFPTGAVESLRQIPEIELIFDDYSRLRQSEPFFFQQTIEALVTDHRTPYNSTWNQAFPDLKLVVSMGLPPSWDKNARINEKGVECRYTADAGTESVAEMTIAAMVCLSRRAAWLNENEDSEPIACELSGKTLGIIGFGRIGKKIAALSHAFGMTILYHDLKGGDDGPSAKTVPFVELLSESDYISLNLPLTPQTKGLISGKAFAAMRQGTFLIDMSQEGIVNTEVMISALESGKLAGVAADVYSRSRIMELNLDRFPHCIWLPLRSAFTRETQARAGLEAVRIIKEYFNV